MGSVFRAKDPVMDRVVALKTILSSALDSEQGSEFRARFYREARAAGALAHPGIVPVFDVGEHEGVPFLVMEFVSGRTLDEAMKKGERSTMERICEIGQQIAEALGYAHRHGVIHRDIKPANILLTSPEAYGAERARITDFGVAKLLSGEMTTTGQILGSPAFMPPEQFTGAPIDGRTDLFSLGVILYWMAAGEQPFSGETMTSVSYKIVHVDPIPPAKLNPAIPAPLERVILKCLAKNPAERYQTGDELAMDLAALHGGGKAPEFAAAAPLATGSGRVSEETLDVRSSLPPKPVPALASASPAKPPRQARPVTKAIKLGVLVLAVLILLAAIAVGGWYYQRYRSQAAFLPAAPAATPVQQPVAPPAALPATPTPTQPAAPTIPKKPAGTRAPVPAAATVANNSAMTPAPAPAVPVVEKAETPAPAVPPPATAVVFDPKKLDPEQNAPLKIDLSHFPPSLAITIEMDGKTYYKGTAGNKADYNNLFVPPGVHEFRLLAGIAGEQKASNTVSTEFVAMKRKTLKVEYRQQSGGAAGASQSETAVQLVATLKGGLFSF
jgi:serine/threonine-protein kinase